MQLKSGYLYEFGPFVLDTSQCLLSREGIPVPIARKTCDLLLLFVESKGRLLPKDELKRSLWPDTFVDDSNLTQQISTARRVLGEAGGENRYIVTVPGRGYRFAAAVTVPANNVTKPQRRLRRAVILASLIAVSLIAVAYAIRSRIAAKPRSLAILPFQSLKVDTENEFL